jgi:hypothetical protein
MDRRRFLEMGGYSEELFFYNEEWDLSARAADRQWPIVCYAASVVCHFRGALPIEAQRTAPASTCWKVLIGLLTLPATWRPLVSCSLFPVHM